MVWAWPMVTSKLLVSFLSHIKQKSVLKACRALGMLGRTLLGLQRNLSNKDFPERTALTLGYSMLGISYMEK